MASDWDDLRFFVALARAGSVRGAAQTLGTNHTTVSRRVVKLEAHLGTRLFDREAAGVRLTAAGKDLVAKALQIEAQIDAFTLSAQGGDQRPEGLVVLASSGALSAVLAPVLARFLRAWPEIRVRFKSTQGAANLDHREADVAVRFAQAVPENLIGHVVARPVAKVYGLPHLSELPTDALPYVAWSKAFKGAPTEQWTADHVPEGRVRMRVNTVPALNEALVAGVGVGFSAEFCRRTLPTLIPMPHPELPAIPLSPVWVLSHPDLRRSARVRVLVNTLRAELPSLLG